MFTYNARRNEVQKVGLVILLACVALGFGNPVLARERGEAHRGAGGAKTEKRDAPVLGLKSQKANENSNAQWPSGATTGQDRTTLRKQGRGNGRAQTDQGTQRRHSKYR
ncbi:MAG: hypothetical protein ABI167_08595 [Nitrosospira sp.]